MSEEEAFAIYVSWHLVEKNGLPTTYNYKHVITLVTTQKPKIEGELRRITIDFNPAYIKEFYVVGIVYQSMSSISSSYSGLYLPVYVFEREECATEHIPFLKENWVKYLKDPSVNVLLERISIDKIVLPRKDF